MLLLLDNYDSFTYNVYQLICDLGKEVEVVRNDMITCEEVEKRGYEAIVISPGPGVPADGGISEELIDYMKGKVPILGICLGHQAIGEVFGGKIVNAGEIVHGKTSPIKHCGKGIFEGIPQNVEIGRYHSLIISRDGLPDCIEVTAELESGMIMAVRHKEYDINGMQFHPESILTPMGKEMMDNWLKTL